MPIESPRQNETNRLAALYELELLDTPMEERFDSITQLAANIFNVPFAAIVFIDKSRQWIKSSSIMQQWESARSESLCSHTILSDELQVVEDLRLDTSIVDLPRLKDDLPVVFYAAIPLKSPNGYNVASLCIIDHKPRTMDLRERQILAQLATIVESKFQRSSELKVTQKLLEYEQQLNVATHALKDSERLSLMRNNTLELVAKSESLKTVLLSIIDGVEHQFEKMKCSILLLDEKVQRFTDGVAPSLPDFYNEAIETVVIGDGVGSCGTAAYCAKRVIVEDIQTHPYWDSYKGLAEKAGLRSCWSEPIINGKGKVLGTFAIYHDRPTIPSELSIQIIEQSAHLASIAIEHDNAEKLIWQQANYDYLTGLVNRQLFGELVKESIKRSQRDNEVFSLLFLDLDRFKEVNDTFGHKVGDRLLIDCAKRLTNCVRSSDNVARLGGDEFVVLLKNIKQSDSIDGIAQKIMMELNKPFVIDGECIYVSASIGITNYPVDGNNYDTLLNNADQAMYRAKKNGRDCYQHFNYSMRDAVNERNSLVSDLRKAIENEELYLLYQPIINLQSKGIVKAEALLRWQHPERGLIAPLDFIPVAEESGLIIPIGEWVIEQALAQSKYMSELLGNSFQISVNTSPVQYLDNHKKNERWIDLLVGRDTEQSSILLEVTENIFMGAESQVIDKLSLFRECGIDVAIDDFGTGYSSLAYLRKYHIDLLKIDKQFIQNMTSDSDDSILCETMIVMAQKLGIDVVAEGIESAEQLELLEKMGCQWGQGYHIAKPMPAGELLKCVQDSLSKEAD